MFRNRTIFCLIFIFFTNPSFSQSITSYIQKNKKNEVVNDIIINMKYIPPYKNLLPIIRAQKLCMKTVFSKDVLLRKYTSIIAIQEYLSLASNTHDTMFNRLIKNSGGINSIYSKQGYYSQKLLDLRRKTQYKFFFDKAYTKQSNSLSMKKVEKSIKSLMSKKNKTNAVNKYLCMRIDLMYTILGGKKYSVSRESIKSAYNLIKNEMPY